MFQYVPQLVANFTCLLFRAGFCSFFLYRTVKLEAEKIKNSDFKTPKYSSDWSELQNCVIICYASRMKYEVFCELVKHPTFFSHEGENIVTTF